MVINKLYIYVYVYIYIYICICIYIYIRIHTTYGNLKRKFEEPALFF